MATKSKEIRIGNNRFPAREWIKNGVTYWRARLVLRDKSAKVLTRKNFPDLKDAVRETILKDSQDQLSLEELTSEQRAILKAILERLPTYQDLQEFLNWKERSSSIKSPTLLEIKTLMLAEMETKEASTAWIRTLTLVFHNLFSAFGEETELISINGLQLVQWFETRTHGRALRTKRNIRNICRAIWIFAQKQKLYPPGETPVDLIPTITTQGAKESIIFTPEEGAILLRKVSPEFLPWILLTGWNGLRTEEVCPATESRKDGLRWENIDWKQNQIIIPAPVTKVKRKRVIPLNPNVRKVLFPLKKEAGRICELDPIREKEPRKLAKHLPDGWKRNGHRKAFISYRGRLIGISAVAQEAGNSEQQCRSTYLDSTTEETAREWFSKPFESLL